MHGGQPSSQSLYETEGQKCAHREAGQLGETNRKLRWRSPPGARVGDWCLKEGETGILESLSGHILYKRNTHAKFWGKGVTQ